MLPVQLLPGQTVPQKPGGSSPRTLAHAAAGALSSLARKAIANRCAGEIASAREAGHESTCERLPGARLWKTGRDTSMAMVSVSSCGSLAHVPRLITPPGCQLSLACATPHEAHVPHSHSTSNFDKKHAATKNSLKSHPSASVPHALAQEGACGLHWRHANIRRIDLPAWRAQPVGAAWATCREQFAEKGAKKQLCDGCG